MSPYRTGVMMFCAYSVVYGRSQSRRPVAASSPMNFCWVMVTIWRVPREVVQHRRPVAGAIAAPRPRRFTGVDVERAQRAHVVPAHVEDDAASIDERREGVGGPERLRRQAGLLPQLLAGRGIERGDDPAHADRKQLAVGIRRRRFRSGAVRRGRLVHRERRRIARPPQHLAGSGVERRHHVVLALPREHEDAIAHQERGGVSGTDVDPPALGQSFGPRLRRHESDRVSVPVRSPPLRPVGRVRLACRPNRRDRSRGALPQPF